MFTDCEGNTQDWVFTYTIEYEDFTIPPNDGEIVQCADDSDVEPTPPSVDDNCGNPLTPSGPVVSAKPGCTGIRTYTWTYTDCENNSHDWVYTYTVDDDTPPMLDCPSGSPFTRNTNLNRCFYTVQGAEFDATASDNCSGTVTLVNDYNNSNTLAGIMLPTGTHIIKWTATDACGNPSECTITIIVNDTQFPTITGCPANQEFNTTASSCSFSTGWANPVASDNCGVNMVLSTSPNTFLNTFIPGFTFGQFEVGTTTVTYTATDLSNNITVCSFTIKINDTTPPTLTGCPSPISVNASATQCASGPVFWTPPTASDNCPGVTLTTTHLPGTSFPVGVTTVTYTATDVHGLTTLCQFTVTVTDNTAPVVTTAPVTRNFTGCNVNAITGPTYSPIALVSSYAVFSDANNQGVAYDNCGIGVVSYQDVITGTCPIEVTRTWTLSDWVTTTSVVQTIYVNGPPVVLNCPANETITTCPSELDIEVAYANWLASVTVSGGCNAVLVHNTPPTPSVCGGTATVVFTVESDCEADVVCTRTFTVVPPAQAVFASAPDISIPCTSAPPTSSSLAYNNSGAGDCLIAGSVSSTISGSHNACGGSYTETWTFTDACGRTITHTRTITVDPTAPPTISAPDNTTVQCSDINESSIWNNAGTPVGSGRTMWVLLKLG
ncbi:MAG: HYR domain-containing protein [Saprospiraceae bacterium]|nr:HYR domain-containing protein [Saprospiraceae bacterium]